MAELLFEIGMEEMPARFVAPAMANLKKLAEGELNALRLDHQGVRAYGTPRRICVVVDGLVEQQPDYSEVVTGPPAKAAFDGDGNPTKAATGFAASQGVNVTELTEINTPKGKRLGLEKSIPGRPSAELLKEVLPKLVKKLNFPKSMRWGQSGSFRFARPIHWFLALFGGQVVPFEMCGIKSADFTRGHRFHAPDDIVVKDAADYLAKLEAADVMADREKRGVATREDVARAVKQAGGVLVPDEELLDEVTDLVETPVACCGGFDKEFLEVPRPVIISAMRSHQRYFALEDEQGNLLPNFVAVNNTKVKDLSVVAAGHEKVLRARLSDARFFVTEDTKKPLIDFLEELGRVTYHAKLGSSLEKVERFRAVAAYLAAELAPESAEKIDRASQLAKADLVTGMVGEFPTLQGVVGAEYARRCGEDHEVAQAIEDHYRPVGSEGKLPEGMVGAIVGLADRFDTICGCFGVGMIPKGGADPYGLRRAAIAILRVAMEMKLAISLEGAIDKALAGLEKWLKKPADEAKAEILAFFAARFAGLMSDQGVPTDVAQAVLAAGFDNPLEAMAKAKALAEVKDSEEFAPLAAGMKRVMNILRKEAKQVPDAPAKPELLVEDAEKGLFMAYESLQAEAKVLFDSGDYKGFLQKLSGFKDPIDSFFDNVMVMAEDDAVRANRLALLSSVAGLFRGLAEFTQLQLG